MGEIWWFLVISISIKFLLGLVNGCAPPGFIPSQDPAFASSRCSDLILYPINAVDQSDQYRFDYSDVGFGNTHAQGATVTITCTTGGQPATVEGFDQFSNVRQSPHPPPSLHHASTLAALNTHGPFIPGFSSSLIVGYELYIFF